MYPLFEGVNMDIVGRTGDKRNTLAKPVTPVTLRHSKGGTKVRSWKGRKSATLRAAYHSLKRACADGAGTKE